MNLKKYLIIGIANFKTISFSFSDIVQTAKMFQMLLFAISKDIYYVNDFWYEKSFLYFKKLLLFFKLPNFTFYTVLESFKLYLENSFCITLSNKMVKILFFKDYNLPCNDILNSINSQRFLVQKTETLMTLAGITF